MTPMTGDPDPTMFFGRKYRKTNNDGLTPGERELLDDDEYERWLDMTNDSWPTYLVAIYYFLCTLFGIALYATLFIPWWLSSRPADAGDPSPVNYLVMAGVGMIFALASTCVAALVREA